MDLWSTNYFEIVKNIDKSRSSVVRLIQKLRKEGKIKRVGSNKTGFWEVIESNKKKDLRELKGKIRFADDYDYKKMRTGK
jgi:CTP-dependent riboflavin kinase